MASFDRVRRVTNQEIILTMHGFIWFSQTSKANQSRNNPLRSGCLWPWDKDKSHVSVSTFVLSLMRHSKHGKLTQRTSDFRMASLKTTKRSSLGLENVKLCFLMYRYRPFLKTPLKKNDVWTKSIWPGFRRSSKHELTAVNCVTHSTQCPHLHQRLAKETSSTQRTQCGSNERFRHAERRKIRLKHLHWEVFRLLLSV